jgi:hypothetical protein
MVIKTLNSEPDQEPVNLFRMRIRIGVNARSGSGFGSALKTMQSRNTEKSCKHNGKNLLWGKFSLLISITGVADPHFVPDPNSFHPGSEFFPFRIRIKEFQVPVF